MGSPRCLRCGMAAPEGLDVHGTVEECLRVTGDELARLQGRVRVEVVLVAKLEEAVERAVRAEAAADRLRDALGHAVATVRTGMYDEGVVEGALEAWPERRKGRA